MDDIRLKELLFLQLLTKRGQDASGFLFNLSDPDVKAMDVPDRVITEMVIHLIERGCVRIYEQEVHQLAGHLRGEVGSELPSGIDPWEWAHPRDALERRLRGCGNLYHLVVTYTGMRHAEELRDALQRDRILDSLGVLMDWRYFHNDLKGALARGTEVPVGVIALDLDGFKRINDEFGHDPGDDVLKAYMGVVKDATGSQGRAYRRGGDEVRAILPGFDLNRTLVLAEAIRKGIAEMVVNFDGKQLPNVTASIGLACCPPDERSLQLDVIADQRQKGAKEAGKNCIISCG